MWYIKGILQPASVQQVLDWFSSSRRTVVEGHSHLQCKVCQCTQVVVMETFQVKSIDRTLEGEECLSLIR